MSKIEKLQFLAPLTVFFAVALAESAAVALTQWPTSEFLWRVNLDVFLIFQRSHSLLPPAIGVPYAQFLFVALPLFALALYGLLRGGALPLAVASNLSLVYAAFLIFVAANTQQHHLAASLSGVAVATVSTGYLTVMLIGVSFAAALVSHGCYLRRICAR
jgi:hypothetical protein